MSSPSAEAVPTRGREVAAWVLYDWANSAYSTLLITVVLHYVQTIVFPGKFGAAVYAWSIGLAGFAAAVLSPILGALADANRNKRFWLAVTALGGAGMALVVAALPPTLNWLVIAAIVLMALLFDLSFVPYNGFLPELADETTMNRVSAWGFAAGYLGGAIPLLMAGLVVMLGPRFGLDDPSLQHRAGIAILGLWWGGFSLPVIFVLRDRGPPPSQRLPLSPAMRAALREVGRTLANVRRLPVLAWFLLAFLLYNDGVQTVITQANTIPTQRLSFSVTELFLLVLVIQLLAMPGALGIAWLADRLGQKRVLLGCLAVWVGLLVAAMLVETKLGFWILGGVLAVVLGGTQSVSRAVMGVLTPSGREAEFFGFFNLTGKAFSWIGPLVFGVVIYYTDSTALAALSLLPLFIGGMAILAMLDVARGKTQAHGRPLTPEP
ncbi:MAG: MFS transporter [Planctomycetota bacterium]